MSRNKKKIIRIATHLHNNTIKAKLALAKCTQLIQIKVYFLHFCLFLPSNTTVTRGKIKVQKEDHRGLQRPPFRQEARPIPSTLCTMWCCSPSASQRQTENLLAQLQFINIWIQWLITTSAKNLLLLFLEHHSTSGKTFRYRGSSLQHVSGGCVVPLRRGDRTRTLEDVTDSLEQTRSDTREASYRWRSQVGVRNDISKEDTRKHDSSLMVLETQATIRKPGTQIKAGVTCWWYKFSCHTRVLGIRLESAGWSAGVGRAQVLHVCSSSVRLW